MTEKAQAIKDLEDTSSDKTDNTAQGIISGKTIHHSGDNSRDEDGITKEANIGSVGLAITSRRLTGKEMCLHLPLFNKTPSRNADDKEANEMLNHSGTKDKNRCTTSMENDGE
jgi:hypothetical protein